MAKFGSCTYRKGSVSSCQSFRYPVIILCIRSRYTSGTCVLDSPWYHRNPAIVYFRQGAIMPLKSPVGFQLTKSVGRICSQEAPILYSHSPSSSILCASFQSAYVLSGVNLPRPFSHFTRMVMVFSPARKSPAGTGYFLGGYW